LQIFVNGEELTFWADTAINEAQSELDARGMPFSIHGLAGKWATDDGRDYVAFSYSCKFLLPSGRCGTYETRPNICRVFEPGESPLCVHFNGAENSEMTGPIS
jgi:Fe-S-cluster containining protein